MEQLNVNPADLLRAADAYADLAAQAAHISPLAAAEVQRIADTHGPMGYPAAVGMAAGLANAQGPLLAKIGDFTTYTQRLTEAAATYTTTDGAVATPFDSLTFGADRGPTKDSDGHVHEASWDKNRAPVPLAPGVGVEPGPKWTDKKVFPALPTAGDVKQSSLNDCYLAATMGAVAHANPQWIKDRIHYNENTTNFDVTLWNGHEWQHITITQSDIQTNLDHHGASWPDPGAPLWPSVLESAYAKMQDPNDSLGHALDYGIGRGGNPPDAMQALTGNRGMSIAPEQVWWTREHLDQDISQALTNHQPVTLSTSTDATLPLVAPHTYMVEGITGSGSDAQLALRNPWEFNPNDPNNGVVTVRLGDVIGSGLTGKLDSLGHHPVSDVNIGELGK